MAEFSTESAVRLKFQVEDVNAVSSTLVLSSIADAHEMILRLLDSGVDVVSPAASLVLGETLLAGAYLMRSLASGSASLAREVRVGGSVVSRAKNVGALLSLAASVEQEAWAALEPYLSALPDQEIGVVTDTEAVLGE